MGFLDAQDIWHWKHNESSPIPNSAETVIPKPSKPCVTYQVICERCVYFAVHRIFPRRESMTHSHPKPSPFGKVMCSALKVILTLDKLLWAVCDIFGGHLNKILNLQRNMGWYQYNTASIWDNIKNGESHWRYICNKKLQVAVFRHHPTWKGTENGANINIYWKQCFQSTSGTSWSIEIIVLPEVSPYCRSWK